MTPIINIIHLSEQQVSEMNAKSVAAEVIRRQSYLEEMAEQRSRFVVWDGIVDSPIFKGISKSHRQIIENAKESKMEMCCIAEDDCRFSGQDAYKYFINSLPEDFDLYFGCVYSGQIGEDNRLLNGAKGILTLYVCHNQFYDTFLNMNPDEHLDNALGEIAFKSKFYVCNPIVCSQINGYSYNYKKQMKYDKYLEGRELFNGL